MPERFRGEFLTMGRYTNLSTFTFYQLLSYESRYNVYIHRVSEKKEPVYFSSYVYVVQS